jgi:stage III sporulation protein AA
LDNKYRRYRGAEEIVCAAEERIAYLLSFLPPKLACKISSVLSGRADYPLGLSEIRLRAGGGSYLIMSGENVYISSGIDSAEAQRILLKFCRGSRYAFEDSVREGYITLPHGIRVGIIAEAKYSGGSLAGIGEISGFVCRIPTAPSSVSGELCSAILNGNGGGALIFSPPSGGKTSALRALASLLGSSPLGKRVVVVDDRGEFCRESYTDCCVDVIKGYKKRQGIELALKSLSPEIIILDELIGDEADELIAAGRGGVEILASVHASDISELTKRKYVERLLCAGIFHKVAGIFRNGEEREIKLYSASELFSMETC